MRVKWGDFLKKVLEHLAKLTVNFPPLNRSFWNPLNFLVADGPWQWVTKQGTSDICALEMCLVFIVLHTKGLSLATGMIAPFFVKFFRCFIEVMEVFSFLQICGRTLEFAIGKGRIDLTISR
jgi:hypothetical protein